MSNIKIKNAIIVLLLMVLGVFYFYRLHYDGYADVFADEIVCNTPVYNNSFDIIPDYKLPADFPRYSVYGKSIIDGDFMFLCIILDYLKKAIFLLCHLQVI